MVVEIPRGDEVDGGKEEEEEDSSSDEDSVSGDGSALEGGIGQGGSGDAPEPRWSAVVMCVCVFIKLHITAQSGLVILVILCHSH